MEIPEELDCSVGTVEKRISYADRPCPISALKESPEMFRADQPGKNKGQNPSCHRTNE